jgi:preprotein translocase subunit SecG
MQTFITIIYVIVALMMVLAILLQAGKGGGLGSALGGGASQGVFGGGGGGDFMAKLTQGMAATFMICAMYLAYASAHAGSDRLKDKKVATKLGANDPIDYEFIGVGAQPLPTPEEGKIKQAKASALVPAQSEGPVGTGTAPDAAPTPDADPAEGDAIDNENRGDSPDSERGDSPQGGGESLQNPPANDDSLDTEATDKAEPGSEAAPAE